jgi:hypothetical protein
MQQTRDEQRVADEGASGDTDPAVALAAEALALDAEEQRLAADVDRWVKRRLDALREEAEAIRVQFETRLWAELPPQERHEWGRIGLRVRPQPSPPATPGAFTVEWCTYSFAHRAGARACFTNYIPKGVGDRYPKNAFCGKLRNWQRPIVDAAEQRFAAIRRSARQIALVRTQLRAALREVRRAGQEGAAD